MDLKQQADLNRQQLTLKMIRFCLGYPILLFSIMLLVAILNFFHARRHSKDAVIGFGLFVGLWVLFFFNVGLSGEMWDLNDDLTP